MKHLVLLGLIFLSSCSVYRSQFDCPVGAGVGCESVSFVNELVDDNGLDNYLGSKELPTKCKVCNPAPTKPSSKMKVWVREYTVDGVKHESHNIYIDAKKDNK